MRTAWSILYRGPLSSCNYECSYCPFAKTENTASELHDDEQKLRRFVDWVRSRQETISILFTPWGEALVRRYYQRALVALSHFSNIARVAIQTNLSCKLDWVSKSNPNTFAFWCTFHPTQTPLNAFLERCQYLHALGFRFSVGVVGTKDSFAYLEKLRSGLPTDVYLWINALKREPNYYTKDELSWLTKVDPLFPYNNERHISRGRACHTGHTVFSVDGDGNMRRCHFVKNIIGNIYEAGFESGLKSRPCSAETCGCHIGYVHMKHLQLDEIFRDGLLERIPDRSWLAAHKTKL